MKRKLKLFIGAIIVLTLIGGGAFMVYVQDYYHYGETAGALLADQSLVTYPNGDIFLSGDTVKEGDVDELVIFYPGGKVEHEAYLPLAKLLSDEGIDVIVCKMPFNLAVFDVNRAEEYLDLFGDETAIYMMGHSLGGAMASSFASGHQDEVDGLILLGSYLYGDYPVDKQLTIYGSFDLVLDRSKIDYTNNVIEIEGGNHSQFGDYGPQEGDGVAQISPRGQLLQTVDAIMEFIGK